MTAAPVQAPASVLSRWNPTVKLATLLLASAIAVTITDPLTPTILWLCAVIGARTAGRVPWRTLGMAHLALAAFAVSIFAANVLLRDGGTPVAHLGPVTVTDAGVHAATALAVRAFYLGVISVVLVTTTDPVRLMTSLHQHAKLPSGATFAILAGMRVLEELPAEWTTIRIAQALRDPGRTPGVLPRSPRALGSATFALLVGAVRRAERITVALESRGLGSGPRTVARPVSLTRYDGLVAAVVVCVVAVVLITSAALGWLSGPAALLAGSA